MKNKKTNSWRLHIVILIAMIIFGNMAIATAIEASPTQESGATASAEASASASGDTASVTAETSVSETGAHASASALASASNGGTATAIAEAWASWSNTVSAYARSIATVVAGIDETAWAHATAEATVTSDGAAQATAESAVGTGEYPGDNNDGSEGNNDGSVNSGNNNQVVTVPKVVERSMGGFIFGKGDIERYCYFKQQLTDDDPKNDNRAKYYINIIAWDYGFKEDKLKRFEDKYKIECATGLEMKDYYP